MIRGHNASCVSLFCLSMCARERVCCCVCCAQSVCLSVCLFISVLLVCLCVHDQSSKAHTDNEKTELFLRWEYWQLTHTLLPHHSRLSSRTHKYEQTFVTSLEVSHLEADVHSLYLRLVAFWTPKNAEREKGKKITTLTVLDLRKFHRTVKNNLSLRNCLWIIICFAGENPFVPFCDSAGQFNRFNPGPFEPALSIQ